MANEYKGLSAIQPLVVFKDVGAYANPAVPIALLPAGAATGRLYLAFDGAIVGVSAHHTLATASAHTVAVRKNDAAISGLTLALAKEANANAYGRHMPDSYPVVAGDYIDATIIGTAVEDAGDVTVIVFVQVGQSQT